MKVQELSQTLRDKGFSEEKQDTGFIYKKKEKHIELICYIEPGIDIDFITLYKWKNNDVKGQHTIPVNDFERSKDSVSTTFKKTLDNMPEYIGDTVNTHHEVRKMIEDIFD
jgi:hypothetical protein